MIFRGVELALESNKIGQRPPSRFLAIGLAVLRPRLQTAKSVRKKWGLARQDAVPVLPVPIFSERSKLRSWGCVFPQKFFHRSLRDGSANRVRRATRAACRAGVVQLLKALARYQAWPAYRAQRDDKRPRKARNLNGERVLLGVPRNHGANCGNVMSRHQPSPAPLHLARRWHISR